MCGSNSGVIQGSWLVGGARVRRWRWRFWEGGGRECGDGWERCAGVALHLALRRLVSGVFLLAQGPHDAEALQWCRQEAGDGLYFSADPGCMSARCVQE